MNTEDRITMQMQCSKVRLPVFASSNAKEKPFGPELFSFANCRARISGSKFINHLATCRRLQREPFL